MITEILRFIVGMLLVVFIPGFAILLAIYPKKKQIPISERIVISLALSMGLIPLLIYYLNVFLKIPITEMNSFLLVSLISGIALLVWLKRK